MVQYPDLMPYRYFQPEARKAIVFPTILNVGWLGTAHRFSVGQVSSELVQKLKDILFYDRFYHEEQRNGSIGPNVLLRDIEEAVRHGPFLCPFCPMLTKAIEVSSIGSNFYPYSETKHLGYSSFQIPGRSGQYSYCFPSLIYHYVAEHSYQPPAEFLEALDAFDLYTPSTIEIDSHTNMDLDEDYDYEDQEKDGDDDLDLEDDIECYEDDLNEIEREIQRDWITKRNRLMNGF